MAVSGVMLFRIRCRKKGQKKTKPSQRASISGRITREEEDVN